MFGTRRSVIAFVIFSILILATVDGLWVSTLYWTIQLLFFGMFLLFPAMIVSLFRASAETDKPRPGLLPLAAPAFFIVGPLFLVLDPVLEYSLRVSMRNFLGNVGKEATITVDGGKVVNAGPIIAALQQAGPARRKGKGGPPTVGTIIEIADHKRTFVILVSGDQIYYPAYEEFGHVGTLHTNPF